MEFCRSSYHNSSMHFFERLQKLRESRPHPCIVSVGSENCAYSPYHARGKNCYLIVGHVLSEDCLYGIWLGVSRDCVDCAFSEKSELLYECVDCRECYNCNFSQDCITCSDCDFCYDCKSCQNCFGCVNLRNKQFHIFNKPYSKEEYFEKVRALKGQHHELGKAPVEFVQLKNMLPHIAFQGVQNENVTGNHIFHTRNAFYCFDINEAEDVTYIFNSIGIKDCSDMAYSSIGTELCYMCHSGVTLFNSNFCNVCWYSQNLEYCEFVYNSHDCFGCVSRSHAEYEILNEKYSKDEYFKKLAQLKDELKKDGTYGRWWWPELYPDIKPHSSYMA